MCVGDGTLTRGKVAASTPKRVRSSSTMTSRAATVSARHSTITCSKGAPANGDGGNNNGNRKRWTTGVPTALVGTTR